jgi:hypothetical protein
MDVHKNARLTVFCRELMVDRLHKGQSKVQVAEQLGVTVRTVSKWLMRYQAEGVRGLEDRSSKPRRSPAATARPHASLAGQPPMYRLGLSRNNLLRLHN